MYTKFDKAIVALVMGAIGLANVFGFHPGVDEHMVTEVVDILTPLLVLIVPNLPKDQ